MPFEIRIPPSPGRARAFTIAAWLVAEGDAVDLGQPLLEVETSKASVDLSSPVAGKVARILLPAGSSIGAGGLAAVVALPGEDVGQVRATYS